MSLYTSSELNYQLKDSCAKAVFCMDHDQFYPTAAEAVKGTDVDNTIICNVKSYLPKWKAILGSFLNKIPKADQHEPNHLFFDQIIEAAVDEESLVGDAIVNLQEKFSLLFS